VTAKDKGTGKEQSITIQDSGNMSKEDIEKAQKEAEAHAEEDKKKREGIDARNQLDSTVYQAEKMKSDYKDKLSEDDVKTLDAAIEAAKKVVADDKADAEALEAAVKELTDKIMPIGAKMYEQNSENSESESPKSESEKSDDKDEPVEGEVVDDKDSDKEK
jgi:molecular chaperone DnaK